MPIGYYDGQLLPLDQIKVSPLDYGFARGMTLFEFTRIYGGVPYRLDEHITRFENGVKQMGLQLKQSRKDIEDAVKHIIAQNKFAHSGIKFYLTLGECGKAGAYGFSGSSDFTPHLMMIEEEFKPQHSEYPKGGIELYQRGIALKTVPFVRQISDAKSINYSAGFIACQQLRGSGYDEILYTHPSGYVTETTVSNFYCVIDGTLHTPEHTMLLGVTRSAVLEVAKKAGIKVVITDITIADVRKASEAFITGSYIEIMPVRKVDDVTFKTTIDGPVYSKLRKALSADIAEKCSSGRT